MEGWLQADKRLENKGGRTLQDRVKTEKTKMGGSHREEQRLENKYEGPVKGRAEAGKQRLGAFTALNRDQKTTLCRKQIS